MRIVILACSLLLLVACSNDGVPDERAKSDKMDLATNILARYSDMEVTMSEFDARLLGMPANERPPTGTDLTAFYKSMLREMIVRRLLLREAEAKDLSSSEQMARSRMQVSRTIALELCVLDELANADPLTEDQVREKYESAKERFVRPERRSTYHLFLRLDDATPEEEVLARANDIRDQALRGANFPKLAADHSQSEWRHQSGHLGFVIPGQLDEGFEEIIFSLPEGVPSEPIKTTDGVHLFFVETVLPRQEMAYEEAAPRIFEEMVAARRADTVSQIAERAPDPLLALDQSEFANAISADAPTVLIESGEYLLTTQDLIERLRRSPEIQASQRAPMTAAYAVYQQMVIGENAYQVCLDEGIAQDPRFLNRVESWEVSALTAMERQRRMQDIAMADDTVLRAFYESHTGQFSQEPAWTIRRLIVPLGDTPSATMATMEQSVAKGLSLESLHEKVGGEIDVKEDALSHDLKLIDPLLPALVAKVEVGQSTAPYRTPDSLQVAYVESMRDPIPLSYDDVKERAASLYAIQHAQPIYEKLVEDLLGEHTLVYNDQAIEDLATIGMPETEVSVEELEELLSTLEE